MLARNAAAFARWCVVTLTILTLALILVGLAEHHARTFAEFNSSVRAADSVASK